MRRILVGTSLIALATGFAGAMPAMAQEQSADTDEQTQFDGITALSDRSEDEAEAEQAEARAKQVEEGEVVTPPPGKAGAVPDDYILVTGSRLSGGDTTSRTQVITREDIERRGVTSVEDLLRTMPENLATVGGIANNRDKGPLSVETRGKAGVSPLGLLGVSAANLGGSGAGNTLVLINGRRMAGAAGIEDGFVNLNDIPLSAIERVEIDTSGSSAVYGADAMGGVINFILRKNFTGTTLSAGYEHSNNGADVRRLSAYSGYGWGTGSISGSVSYREADPVVNAKTGFVTQNYADYFNGDLVYDRRSFGNGGQPGLIDITTEDYIFDPEFMIITYPAALTVPDGFVGAPGIDDFITVGPEAKRDFVPKYGGSNSKSLSFTANFEQEITDKLTFSAAGLFTRNKNFQDTQPETGIGLSLAPGQYYNPFPAFYDYGRGYEEFNPTVYYFPSYEIANGEVEYGSISSTAESWRVNAELRYDFNADTTLELLYTRSGSSSKARSDNFSSIASISQDYSNPGQWSCYNFFVANPDRYQGTDFDNYVDVFNRQCEALTSTDPDIAFNPWKTGADGGGSSISAFFWQDDRETRSSDLENYEARLRGSLFNLPGGPIRYALGAELNTDGVSSREVRNLTGVGVSQDRHAFFGELSLPVLGYEKSLPLVHALTFHISARRDVYKTDGAVGTVGDVPYEDGVEIVYKKSTFARTTPTYGVRWEVTPSFFLRGRISHGFKQPPYTQLFNVNPQEFSAFINGDPFYDCRENGDCDLDFGEFYYGYYVDSVTASNPDLKPQTSVQHMLNALWRPQQGPLRGLTLEATYNRTRINNSYATTDDLFRFLPIEDQYARPEFYPRDENGRITQRFVKTFNIGKSIYSSVVYSARYLFDTPVGSFEPSITYLKNLKSEIKPFEESETIDTIGKLQGNDRYKITGQLSWYKDDISMTLLGYYTPSYTNDYEVFTSAGVIQNPAYAKKVSDYTTFDLTATWRVNDLLKLNFAGRNIFDAKPPFAVVGDVPYDAARYDLAGRRLYVQAQVSF